MQRRSAGRARRAARRRGRRGARGRRARDRQRRRHRQPRTDRRRGGGDRGDRRLGLLRPRPVRPLQPLHPDPGGGLRAADRAPPRPRRRDRARRRLPRLGRRQRRPAARSPGCPPGLAARRRGGRRRGADAAARRRPPTASRSATASTCATPRPASSASASTRCTWSRAARSSTSSPPTAATARPSSRRGGPRTRLGVLVGEGAARVELVAGGLELGPARVARRQRLGGLEVALAPVRAAAVVVHDLLDRFEVGAPLHPPVLVDGDVGGVALVRGAEQGVVGGGDPHLDREEDRVAVARAPTRSPAAPPPGRARAAPRTPSR